MERQKIRESEKERGKDKQIYGQLKKDRDAVRVR